MLIRTAGFTLALLTIGCGGGDAISIDAAITVDASPASDAAPDAATCVRPGYPEMTHPVSVDLAAPTPLALTGAGTRCEQIIRALLTPSTQPPELHQLDPGGVTGTCSHDDVLNREIVRLRAPNYGGLPLFGTVQDALVHVSAADTVVFLHADYLPAGATVASACFDANLIASRVPGQPLGYQRFQACAPNGSGTYPIATDDVIEVGDEGLFLDEQSNLRRARAVDVYLAPGHATSEIINSDAYCCLGPSLDHCVGTRMFIDAVTGDLLGQEPHCHTC
jgi:hypothetical protein